MIYTLDLEGNITSFNRAFQIISGFNREEIGKKNILINISYLSIGKEQRLIFNWQKKELYNSLKSRLSTRWIRNCISML
ncbi:MAG: PAS domain S-box protein [Bacillus sp. (in: Bacteria)]|nr:PAS domain S-box protein [Bacillus sp. (in: firmicutes)]